MIMMKNEFIRGAIYKAMLIGGVCMIGGGLIWDMAIAASIGVGVLIASANLAFMTWFIGRVLSRAGEGSMGALGWSVIFLLKLLVLFGLTYYVLVVVRLNALGYTSGYIIVLAAITWQGLIPPSQKTHTTS